MDLFADGMSGAVDEPVGIAGVANDVPADIIRFSSAGKPAGGDLCADELQRRVPRITDNGEDLALAGRNVVADEAGVLSRITTPTKGEAKINGRLGALLEVGTGFHQELTGGENTFLYGSILGMKKADIRKKFDASTVAIRYLNVAESASGVPLRLSSPYVATDTISRNTKRLKRSRVIIIP